MKSQIKFRTALKAALLLCIFSLFIGAANAQDKPKGKPWPAPESAEKMKNPVECNAEALAEGKALYAKHCKSCHGTKGKGDGTKAATLDISSGDFTSEEFQKQSDGAIYWKTWEGRDPMPTFKKKLSSDECWKIVHHVRTFK